MSEELVQAPQVGTEPFVELVKAPPIAQLSDIQPGFGRSKFYLAIRQFYKNFSWQKIVRWLLVSILPLVAFFFTLVTTNLLSQPPDCQPKLIENLVCKTNYQIRILQGLKAEWNGNHGVAIQAYSAALLANPAGLQAREMRAQAYQAIGLYDRALEDYQALIVQNAEHIDAYLGVLEIQNQADPSDLETMCKLGLVYAYHQDWLALEAFLEAAPVLQKNEWSWCWFELERLNSTH